MALNDHYFGSPEFDNLDPEIRKELKDYYEYIQAQYKQEMDVYQEYYQSKLNKDISNV